MGTAGEGEGETDRESSIEIYTSPNVKQRANGSFPDVTGSSSQCSVTTWRTGMGLVVGGGGGGGEGGRKVQEGGYTCIPMADSC